MTAPTQLTTPRAATVRPVNTRYRGRSNCTIRGNPSRPFVAGPPRSVSAPDRAADCDAAGMPVLTDAQLLLTYLDRLGVDGGTEIARGWTHMGAVVVDASLQRRQRYVATVLPRVSHLVAVWPDAKTTDGFRRRLNTGELARVIRWNGQQRLVQIEQTTTVLESLQIKTVHDLSAALSSPDRRDPVRTALRAVSFVGDKTLDYFDILTGKADGVAIDVRVRRVARAAGITTTAYWHLSSVIRHAAAARGWRAGDLDAAIWNAGANTKGNTA